MILNKRFFLNLLLGIILSFILIILSVKLTLNFKALYYWDIKNLSITGNTDLNIKEIKEDYNYLIYYLNSHKEIIFSLPNLPSSKQGIIHFKDVKNIFTFLDKVLLLNIIISLPLIYHKAKNNKDINFLKFSSILLIIIPFFMLIPLILNFNKGFTVFHKILFSNDYWLFSPENDPIINLLPEKFFLHCVLLILFFILLFSITLYILYKYCRKKLQEY